MTLGKKTVILFLALGICFCVGSFVALKLTVLPPFEAFEYRTAEERLTRVNRLLESDLRALEVMNIEYSAWDDTYDFVLGNMPEYADQNLDPAYWHSISINLMLILDPEGEILFEHLGDPVSGEKIPLDNAFDGPITSSITAVSPGSTEALTTGLLSTNMGLIQVVSNPIVNTAATTPAAGTLVIGKFLTGDRIRQLGERATVSVSLFTLDSRELPQRIAAAARTLRDSHAAANIVIDDQFVHAYQLLEDAHGHQSIMLKASEDRRISQIGGATVRTATLFVAIASLVFLLAAWLFMHRLIARPVRELTRLILDMRKTGNLDINIDSDRSDEVGLLASEFGELASRLQVTRDELEAARDGAVAMSDAKSEFLARMSHEIRTPMNGVLGMTELLRDTELNDRQSHFAKTIYESAEALLQIINDILDISKIEAGRLELDTAPLNLRNVVEECLELLAETAHSKGLELVCNIPHDTHVNVRGDGMRIRQVLMNLVGNAVKFTHQGEVTVSMAQSDKDSGNYRFEVADTGVGIRPENVSKIFEPFSQEDGSTTRRYGGTGLGLSISKQLVELMGGDIGLESTFGEGCVFWFTVQLELDETTSEFHQPGLFIDKTVLIVDDNDTNREILSHQLGSWGMRVVTAASGPDALVVLSETNRRRENIDLILLDMSMPGMDGLQLAHTISQLSSFNDVPVVMLSSLSRADLNTEQLQSGPKDWLTKPVRQARLCEVLNAVLCRADPDLNTEQATMPARAVNDDIASAPLRVLLADDNVVNREVATAMIKYYGHRVTSVNDGKGAVSAAKERQHDLILMDCRMPEMDGYEATRTIRQWEERHNYPRIPIIALTANTLEGDREQCLDAGMDDHLGKPITKIQLRSILEKFSPPDQAAIVQESAGHVSPDQEPDKTPGTAQRDRILVVDDNDVNQQIACMMLTKLGYESLAVSSGEEALSAMSAGRFALVLMDCHMPGLDGCATTKEIRRLEKLSATGRRIPIIALTADFLESNRQKCVDAGFNDYFTKPVTQEALHTALARWLDDDTEHYREPASDDVDGFSIVEDAGIMTLDRNVLQEIRDLDSTPGASVLRDIVMSYCTCSIRSILQLRSAVQDGEPALIQQAAHSVKGASSQVGAKALAAICEDLISSARHGNLAESRALCERIAIEHSAVIAALEKELQAIAA